MINLSILSNNYCCPVPVSNVSDFAKEYFVIIILLKRRFLLPVLLSLVYTQRKYKVKNKNI